MTSQRSLRTYPSRVQPRAELPTAVGRVASGRYLTLYTAYTVGQAISKAKEQLSARYHKDQRVYTTDGQEPDENARRAGWQLPAVKAKQHRGLLIELGIPAKELDLALADLPAIPETKVETKAEARPARQQTNSSARMPIMAPGLAVTVTVGSFGTLTIPVKDRVSDTEWTTAGPPLIQVGGQWQIWGLGLPHTVALPTASTSGDTKASSTIAVEEKKHLFSPDKVAVAIVGSAGRKDDAVKMNPALYERMITAAHKVITDEFKLDPAKVELASGGAAHADHVAVDLAIEHPEYGLKLFLPAIWDAKAGRAYDNGIDDWKLNPGGQLNHYHAAFSKACELDSLKELSDVIAAGAIVDTSANSVFERNDLVAQAPYLIALTWGTGAPKAGGTAYTWGKCKGKRVHIDLGTL